VVDEVVKPELSRGAIAQAIVEAPQVKGTHGNIPL